MSDDELRRRLRDLPGPGSRIDVDAVVERAKRRRRPKVAAVTAATAGAGVLIIAPFVAPGLQSLQPMSAPGSAVAPAEEESGGGADSAAPAEDLAGSTLADACAAVAATGLGVELRFVDDPADGVAELAVASLLDERSTVTVEAAGSATVDAEGVPVAIDLGTADSIVVFELPSRAAGSTAVELAPPTACEGAGDAAGLAPLARVTVEHDGQTSAAFVVGEPFAVR